MLALLSGLFSGVMLHDYINYVLSESYFKACPVESYFWVTMKSYSTASNSHELNMWKIKLVPIQSESCLEGLSKYIMYMVHTLTIQCRYFLQKDLVLESYGKLDEHLWISRAWQESQTRTGFGEEGKGSSLSEQALQKISPQFLQWC